MLNALEENLNISEIQNQIIEEFSVLDGDIESTLEYLIDLGNDLPELEERYKIKKNKIEGCISDVWVYCAKDENDILSIKGDSNSKIVKGLISLIFRIYSDQTSEQILNSKLYFMKKIGLTNMIGSQRTSGYISILKHIFLFLKIGNDKI